VLLCFNHYINTQVQPRSTKHTLNPFIESSSYPIPFLFLTCATKYFHTKHKVVSFPYPLSLQYQNKIRVLLKNFLWTIYCRVCLYLAC